MLEPKSPITKSEMMHLHGLLYKLKGHIHMNPYDAPEIKTITQIEEYIEKTVNKGMV